MNYSRGNIVIVPFPFITSGKQKIQTARPALQGNVKVIRNKGRHDHEEYILLLKSKNID